MTISCRACQSQHAPHRLLLPNVGLVGLFCFLVCFNEDKVKFKEHGGPWEMSLLEALVAAWLWGGCSPLCLWLQMFQPCIFSPVQPRRTCTLAVSLHPVCFTWEHNELSKFPALFPQNPSFRSKKDYLSKITNCINCQNNCLAWF